MIIKTYDFSKIGKYGLELPHASKILKVKQIGKELKIWVLEVPSAMNSHRKFFILEDEVEFKETEDIKARYLNYICSFKIRLKYHHFFEVKR